MIQPPHQNRKQIEGRVQEHADGQVATGEIKNRDYSAEESRIDQLERPSFGDVVRQGKEHDGDGRCNATAADQLPKLFDNEPPKDKLLKHTRGHGCRKPEPQRIVGIIAWR